MIYPIPAEGNFDVDVQATIQAGKLAWSHWYIPVQTGDLLALHSQENPSDALASPQEYGMEMQTQANCVNYPLSFQGGQRQRIWESFMNLLITRKGPGDLSWAPGNNRLRSVMIPNF
jgi:hypothetical protein